MSADWRQMQELEEEREADIMRLLLRVESRCGREDALAVASHLGYRNEFVRFTSQPSTKRRAVCQA